MRQADRKFVLRNHLGEPAVRKTQGKDFSELARPLRVREQQPFDEHPASGAWAGFPPDRASGIEIGCSP